MKTKGTLLSVIVLFVGCSLLYLFDFKKNIHKSAHAKTITVFAAKAALQEISQTTSTSGTLFANQSTDITAKVSGYITQIFYHEGDKILQGSPLVQLDNREEQAILNEAQTEKTVSQLEFQRNQKFLQHGFVTEDVLYNSKEAYEQKEAAVIEDNNKLEDKTIRAPFNGIVGEKTFSIGSYVTAGTKITSFVDINSLRLEYTLPSELQNKIALGQKVTIQSDAIPDKTFPGKVTYIGAAIDPVTQTIPLHAQIDNPQGVLKAGQFVRISQVLGSDKKIIVIPPQSLIAEMNGYYVFVIKNHKAIKTAVAIGKKFYNEIEVKRGLNANDSIVTAGQNNLQDGSPILIKNSSQTS